MLCGLSVGCALPAHWTCCRMKRGSEFLAVRVALVTAETTRHREENMINQYIKVTRATSAAEAVGQEGPLDSTW